MPGVEAAFFPAINDIVTFVEFLQKAGNLFRVILQVGVHHHNNRPTGSPHTSRQSGCFGKVATKADPGYPAILRSQPGDNFPGTVRGTIVDKNDFEINIMLLTRVTDLLIQLWQTFGFI